MSSARTCQSRINFPLHETNRKQIATAGAIIIDAQCNQIIVNVLTRRRMLRIIDTHLCRLCLRTRLIEYSSLTFLDTVEDNCIWWWYSYIYYVSAHNVDGDYYWMAESYDIGINWSSVLRELVKGVDKSVGCAANAARRNYHFRVLFMRRPHACGLNALYLISISNFN